MARKHKNIDTFACPVEDDNNDISGFSDEPIIKGKCLSSFSFDDTKSDDSDNNEDVIILQDHEHEENISKDYSFTNSTANSKNPDTNKFNSITNIDNSEAQTDNLKENATTEIFDNRRTPIANGSAPAINGETPSIRRCYILRESTIRKINELKMMDKDINVCVSTIVDLAIDYYYKTI